jgi:hypothetical protein
MAWFTVSDSSSSPPIVRVSRGNFGPQTTASIIAEQPERIEIAIENAAGWLVMNDAYSPGWHARLVYLSAWRGFGRSLAPAYGPDLLIAPAFGAIRTIPINNGYGNAQRWVIEYKPRGWRYGLIASALGGILVLILVALVLSGVGSQECITRADQIR